MTEEPFIQAIIAAPEAVGPLQVYADWLEEHGSTTKAEMCRVVAAIAELDGERWPDQTKKLGMSSKLKRRYDRLEKSLKDYKFHRFLCNWRDRWEFVRPLVPLHFS